MENCEVFEFYTMPVNNICIVYRSVYIRKMPKANKFVINEMTTDTGMRILVELVNAAESVLKISLAIKVNRTFEIYSYFLRLMFE